MKKSLTYEISILCLSKSGTQAEVLKCMLESLGVKQTEVFEVIKHGKAHLSIYFTSKNKAERFKSSLNKLHIKKIKIQTKGLEKKDWQSKWKEDFKPLKVTSKLTIVPAWLKKKYKSTTRRVIYLDTGLAFGSGMHPTTRFMIQFIERCSRLIKSFLDVGTGSGILSLTAAKFGVNDITAIDTSYEAIKAIRNNFKINECTLKKALRGDLKNISLYRQYDFTAANLSTFTLMNNKRKLISLVKKGGYLAVSGISLYHLKELKDDFKSLRVKCLKITKDEGWSAVLFKKL